MRYPNSRLVVLPVLSSVVAVSIVILAQLQHLDLRLPMANTVTLCRLLPNQETVPNS